MLPHTGILTSHKIHTWIWNRRQSWIVWYTITSSTSNYTHRNSPMSGENNSSVKLLGWRLGLSIIYQIWDYQDQCVSIIPPLISWLASGIQGKGVGNRVLWCQKCCLWSGSWFKGGLNYNGNFTWLNWLKKVGQTFYTFTVNVNMSAIIIWHNYNINWHC